MALTEIDRNLIKRCLTRHPGAWKDFVDRYLGLFIHVINHTLHAHSLRGTHEDVDDLSADIFLEILADDFAVLRKFRGKSSLATYLTVIARRVVIRTLMTRRYSEAMGHVLPHRASLAGAQVSKPDQQRVDDREEIQVLLRSLPERDATVVRLFHLDGKSYREIEQLTGLPENSIGAILSRAREQLRARKAVV